MYQEGYNQLRALHRQLNTLTTQYFILRFYAHSGPTTEFMFLHRLTCVVLYHIDDLKRFKIQMRGFLKIFMKRAPYGQSFLSVYGFIFYTIPHMLTIPYQPQKQEPIALCEEIGSVEREIPPLRTYLLHNSDF